MFSHYGIGTMLYDLRSLLVIIPIFSFYIFKRYFMLEAMRKKSKQPVGR